MPPLLDHRLLLIIPLASGTPKGAQKLPPSPSLYWRQRPQQVLARQLQWPAWTATPPGADVRAARCLPGPGATSVLALNVTLREPDLDDLLHAANDLRMLRPWYPTHTVPGWSRGGATFPWLAGLIDHLVPGAQPLTEDARALTLVYAAFDHDPGDATRYRLTYADPPDMPSPPADLLAEAMTRFAYRRWAAAGTTWTFCHHGGACVWYPIDGGPPPTWLGQLFDSTYLELAMLVGRLQIGRSLHHKLDNELGERLDHPRCTEQDQGRHLLRAWLAAIEHDQHNLE